MNKKALILTILGKLVPYWPMAEGLEMLLGNLDINEDILNGLIKILSKSIENNLYETDKEKLKKGLNIIKQIQEKEKMESQISDEELNEMLKDL